MKILNALLKKEFFQIIRDPSSIIIAFVCPFKNKRCSCNT